MLRSVFRRGAAAAQLFLSLFLGTGLGSRCRVMPTRSTNCVRRLRSCRRWRSRFGLARRERPLETFLGGMGDSDALMLMCLIFLLAGAFAAVSKAIGTSIRGLLALSAVPPWLALPGLFLVAGFVALRDARRWADRRRRADRARCRRSSRHRTGARAGAVPVVARSATTSRHFDPAIAASRLQGSSLRDKFREFLAALPAALATLSFCSPCSAAARPRRRSRPRRPGCALPYLVVLVPP